MKTINTKTYKINDMKCASCASLIQVDLEDAGYKCKCSYASGLLEVSGKHNTDKVMEIVKNTGYTVTLV